MFKKNKTVEPEETTTEEVVPHETNKKNHKEHVWGTLLLATLIIIVCFGLFGAGFGAFVLWQKQTAQNEAPSIHSLADQPASIKTNTEEKEVLSENKPATQEMGEILKKAQGLDVIIMNGGGAKGVATEAADYLKGKSFSRVTVGNTKADFVGAVIYYKKDYAEEAGVVKDQLKSKYPAFTTQEADSANPETATATITVIFGK